MEFGNVAITVLVLIALAVPGYLLRKVKMLNDTAGKTITNIVFYVCQPAIIFESVLMRRPYPYGGDMLHMVWSFVAGFFSILVIGIVTKLIIMKWGRGKDYNKEDGWGMTERIMPNSLAFSNAAFLGIPVVMMLFGRENPEPILYLVAFALAFNILSWTKGTYLMSQDKKFLTVKRAILNPPTLAIVVALPLFFLAPEWGVYQHADHVAMTAIRWCSEMVAPLAMTALGIKFADIKFTSLFTSKIVYITAALKLIVVPIIAWGILVLLTTFAGFDETLATVIYIIILMPTAVTVLLFAEKFNLDTEMATKIVLFTTLFSMLTLPLMLMLPMSFPIT